MPNPLLFFYPRVLYLSIGIGLLFWTTARAQPYAVSVKHWGPENGLSHREVNAIFQDRQGFMWFGTKLGLNRFDGKRFTTFTKEGNGLDFDDIRSIAQDAEGNLWLWGDKSQSRISIFNPLTNQAISFEQKFKITRTAAAFNDLQGLVSGSNGTIFLTNRKPATLISYSTAGLRSVSLPQFDNLGLFRATTRNTCWGLVNENEIVELTADGRVLNRFLHKNSVVSWCYGQRNAGIDFFYMVYHPATRQHQFFSVDELGQRREWPSALLQSMIRYMGPISYPVDRTGLLWDGISLRDSTNRTLLSIREQTSGETIENRSFYCDQNGMLWLGTSFGVYQVKLTRNHFQRLFYQENKGDPIAAVRGITVVDNQLFANLEKFGLYSVPRQGGVPQKVYSDGTFVYGLARDEQGKLYVGAGNRLVEYALATRTASQSTLPDDYFSWAIHPFGPAQWLVGGQSGLMVVSTQNRQSRRFEKYNAFPELAQSQILHIAPDRQGTVWICATTGLYTVDPARGITARYWSGGLGAFQLPSDSYQHFYQDSKGIYWLATANAGLIRWDRKQNQVKQFRRSEGLSNDNIYAVYPDRSGKLWMSSDYGIMQFDPVRLTTRTYLVQDGITHNEFNRISHFQDKNGSIYFGGLNGITAFDPKRFEEEKPPVSLPIRMLSFRQHDKSLDQIVDKTGDLDKTGRIIIQPGDQTATLDFALLNYTDAEKNSYAFQFEGLDDTWTHQTESSLRLGNLPYGTYQLLIKGQASNGRWSANTLRIQIEVLRPFYWQGWFLTLMALLIIGGTWLWMRWRSWNHQQEQKRLQNEIRLATARIEEDKELIEQQAQMLQQLNESKSRFFANISHEFRTPLTVILGMTSELKRHHPNGSGHSGRRELDQIERNGNNLLRLINQILDLSKIEAGEMRLQLNRADLVRFCRYVAEPFQSMAGQKNIQLHFQSDDDALETDFDPNKLQDILSNLFSNAIKFTPPGGRIDFRLSAWTNREPAQTEGYFEAVSPRHHPTDSWISLSVRDTGPGIEADQLPRIFNRFFQVADHPIPETGGTGIGLSLVRELVVLMNGGLAVRGLPGQGTEFIIRLRQTRQAPMMPVWPVKPDSLVPDRLETDLALEPETSREKPTLLLVEDNEDVAAYIRSCLQEKYRITRAANGQEGINQALETIPDLILSDVIMPEKDGFQVCDALKNDLRTSHIPIVLLTARAADSDRIRGLRRGADAYLTKPFQREELLVVLDNLLQSRRVLQLYYSQLALNTGAANPPAREDANPLEAVFLQKLRTLLEAELSNSGFSIEEICRQMGVSRTTLHQKLVALTGMSITRYIRALRLAKAKELLTTTSLNISEVAYAVGFDDPKYFSRVFSEEFSISPLSFRLSAPSEQ